MIDKSKGAKMGSIKYLLIAFVFSTTLHYSQNKYTVEGSIGIISPFNSSSGLTGSIQVNRSLNENLQLFLNGGYGNGINTIFITCLNFIVLSFSIMDHIKRTLQMIILYLQ